MSKAGLSTLAAVWADELEKAGKPRMNVLVPGPIATPQRRRSHPGEDPGKLRSAQDAARAFLWLLGPDGRGTSGKTLSITVPANDAKRFVVGARAAQRLTVSAGHTKAQIHLLEEARITEGINNFLAVLPKTGDYTIEVSNPTDQEITVTLNIKIQ